MPSRLEAFVGGTGIGILSRLMDVSTLCAILSYYLLLSNPSVFKVRILHHLLFISLIVFLVLSGSKAAFLNLVFCLFCLERFYPGLRAKLKSIPPFSILKNKVVVGLVGLTLALAIVALQKAETPLNPYMELAYRFMLSGDVYYLSYPNNVYKLIENEHGFLALFQDFLGLFRIYAWDELPQAIGLDLTRYHHSGDLMWGPNARHNVFGLVYYGFVGSIIFSFSLGAVVSFVREKVLIMPFNNVFFYLFFSLLYIKITFVETDPMLALSYLSNVFLIFPMLLLIFLVLYDQLVIFRRINI